MCKELPIANYYLRKREEEYAPIAMGEPKWNLALEYLAYIEEKNRLKYGDIHFQSINTPSGEKRVMTRGGRVYKLDGYMTVQKNGYTEKFGFEYFYVFCAFLLLRIKSMNIKLFT